MLCCHTSFFFFFFNDPATTEIYTLPLHAPLPIFGLGLDAPAVTAEVMPVEQHRAQRSHQPVGDIARAGGAVIRLLRLQCAEHRYAGAHHVQDRKSTRLNSSHSQISYAVFCLKKKK